MIRRLELWCVAPGRYTPGDDEAVAHRDESGDRAFGGDLRRGVGLGSAKLPASGVDRVSDHALGGERHLLERVALLYVRAQPRAGPTTLVPCLVRAPGRGSMGRGAIRCGTLHFRRPDRSGGRLGLQGSPLVRRRDRERAAGERRTGSPLPTAGRDRGPMPEMQLRPPRHARPLPGVRRGGADEPSREARRGGRERGGVESPLIPPRSGFTPSYDLGGRPRPSGPERPAGPVERCGR